MTGEILKLHNMYSNCGFLRAQEDLVHADQALSCTSQGKNIMGNQLYADTNYWTVSALKPPLYMGWSDEWVV